MNASGKTDFENYYQQPWGQSSLELDEGRVECYNRDQMFTKAFNCLLDNSFYYSDCSGIHQRP